MTPSLVPFEFPVRNSIYYRQLQQRTILSLGFWDRIPGHKCYRIVNFTIPSTRGTIQDRMWHLFLLLKTEL